MTASDGRGPVFLTLQEAVQRFVTPGASVALEGFTHLIPFAAGHEIIRQGLTDLTLIRMTPDLLYDQMIGAGCARRLVFSWGGNQQGQCCPNKPGKIEKALNHHLYKHSCRNTSMIFAFACRESQDPCSVS